MSLHTELRMRHWLRVGLLTAILVGGPSANVALAVSPTLNFQGRISTDHIPAEGEGRFKFALIDAAGTAVWSHAPDLAPADGEPDTTITLPLHHGHFAVELGEGMNPLPSLTDASLASLRLRIWFGEGDQNLHRLQPETPLVGLPTATRSMVTAETQTLGGPVSVLQIAGNLANAALPANIARLDSSPVFSGPVTAPQFVGAGVESWIRTEDTDVLTRPNLGYLVGSDAGRVRVHLPADARAGDVVRVRGVTTGGWRIAESEGITLELPAGYLWQVSAPDLQWLDLASSADGQRLLAAPRNGQLHVSTDGGATWEPRGEKGVWATVGSSSDGQVLMAGESSGSLWRSVDGGVSWQSLNLPGAWRSLATSSDGSRWLAGTSSGPLWRSEDAGAHWVSLTFKGGTGTTHSVGIWTAVASSADGRKLVAAEYKGPIWTSADGGSTWSPRHRERQWLDIASSADGARLFAADDPSAGLATTEGLNCHEGSLWISTDSGETWNPSGPPGCYDTVVASADGQRVFAHGFGPSLYLSDDGGQTWDQRELGFGPTALATSADGRRLIGASTTSPLYRSVPEARGGLGSDTAWQSLGEGRWLGVTLGTLSSDGTIDLDSLGLIDGASFASGTLALDRLPELRLSSFEDGVFSPTQVPSRLTRDHLFPDGLQIGGANAGAAPVSVRRDQANARFGYALSLHDRDGTAWWKLGTDNQGRFSLGAAGLRDDDLSIDRATGNVGLGTTPSTDARLSVAGSVETTDSAHFGGEVHAKEILVISDARRKTRIASVENALTAIERLRGVHFAWRSPEDPDAPDTAAGLQSGFLAQEVAAVLPEAVETNATGLLRLNYEALTPVLVEALKQLRQQLHERLVTADATLAQLEAGIAQLETKRSSPPFPAP